ncbi:hypothetical protein JNW90_35210 [Micromonospora sp. STR1s_5]|nr:hypothetical protein [Micromonospora sp. STR1s_5]
MPRSNAPILRAYLARLEAVRADAEADGLHSLEYLITMARIEAERLIEQGQDERGLRNSYRDFSRQLILEEA